MKENILVIFDIDDTLIKSQTKVRVLKNKKIIKELSSSEYSLYSLNKGESFDFELFASAKDFFEKSQPILPMIDQLKKDIKRGNKVVMVTARQDFDDKNLFLKTFSKYDIDMSQIYVYRAGNIQKGKTEEKKKLVIDNILTNECFSKIIMYDDSVNNLLSFLSLKEKFNTIKFYAWLVFPNGEAKEYLRR